MIIQALDKNSPKNITGSRYGLLTIVEKSHQDKGGNWMWLCKCDCGNTTFAVKYNLDQGCKKSCGCLQGRNGTHGMSFTSEHNAWRAMKARCLNPNNREYIYYGNAGITICVAWMSFENFFKDMGLRPSSKHSLDRIDNKKGYYPENCKWSTQKEQTRNRSTSKIWNINGVIFDSCTEAALYFKVSDSSIKAWCRGSRKMKKRPDCSCHLRYL